MFDISLPLFKLLPPVAVPPWLSLPAKQKHVIGFGEHALAGCCAFPLMLGSQEGAYVGFEFDVLELSQAGCKFLFVVVLRWGPSPGRPRKAVVN